MLLSDYKFEPELRAVCEQCQGDGRLGGGGDSGERKRNCSQCGGVGFHFFAAARPTQHAPGSREKLAILCARYREGGPLFVPGDADVRHDLCAARSSDNRFRLSIPRPSIGEGRGVR